MAIERSRQILAHALGLTLAMLTFTGMVALAPQPWQGGPDDDCLGLMNNETREAVGKMVLLDYPSYYHCCDGPPAIFKVLFLTIWLGLMISLLASTADNFFVPQLETMSDRLQLSEDVAGVTLLALGNGMPDVMTANSALSADDEGFGMMMGEFLGASNFIVGCILGIILLVQNVPTTVDGVPFLRDTAAYLLVLLLMVAVTWDRVITMLESLLFFLVYVMYVAAVVLPSRMRRSPSWMRRQDSMFGSAPHWSGSLSDTLEFTRGQPANTAALLKASTELSEIGETLDSATEVQRFNIASTDANMMSDDPANEFMLLESDTEEVPTYDVNELEGFSAGNSFAECMVLTMEWPFTVIRHITIPSAQWSSKRRHLAALCPVFGSNVIMLSFYGPEFFQLALGGIIPCWSILSACGVGCGIAIIHFSTPSKMPPWHSFLLAFSFTATVAWFKLFADETVALLNVLGLKLGLSASILGATVLAWGNCVGDLVADTALVRKGKAKMAVAGVFGSPLMSEELHVVLTLQNKIAAAFAVLSLFTSVGFFSFFSFTCPRWFGKVLLAEYLVYTIVAILGELNGW